MASAAPQKFFGGSCGSEELGVVGPAEGFGGAVVGRDERGDLLDEVVAGGEVAAAEHAAGQDREEDLHHVQPVGVAGGVGHGEARVLSEPRAGLLGGVRGAVVEDQVDLLGRVDGLVQFGEELG